MRKNPTRILVTNGADRDEAHNFQSVNFSIKERFEEAGDCKANK